MKNSIKALAILASLGGSLFSYADENPLTDLYTTDIAPQWENIVWENIDGEAKQWKDGSSVTLGKPSDGPTFSYKILVSDDITLKGLYMDEYAHWHFAAGKEEASLEINGGTLKVFGTLTIGIPVFATELILDDVNELRVIDGGDLSVADFKGQNSELFLGAGENSLHCIELRDGAFIEIGADARLETFEMHLLKSEVIAGNITFYGHGTHEDKAALTISSPHEDSSAMLSAKEVNGAHIQYARLRLDEGASLLQNCQLVSSDIDMPWTNSELVIKDSSFFHPATKFNMVEGAKLTIDSVGMDLMIEDIEEKEVTLADGSKKVMPVLSLETFDWNAENTQIKGTLSLLVTWGENEELLKVLAQAKQDKKMVGVVFPDILFKNAQITAASMGLGNEKDIYTDYIGCGQDENGCLVIYGEFEEN